MDTPKRGFFSKKSTKIAIGIIAGIIVISYFLFQEEKPEYVLAEAVKGEIIQTVSVTGTIKANPTIDLHFQKTGKVNDIFVEEGEEVNEDQLLASLENETLSLEVERMRANLNYAVAQYNQTGAGAKFEEIQIAAAEVESAQAAYEAALVELDNTKEIGDSNIDLATIAYKQAEDNKDTALKEFETTKDLAEKEIAKLELGGDSAQSVALDGYYNTAQTQLDSIFTVMQNGLFLAEDIIGIRGLGFELLSHSKKNLLKINYYYSADTDYQDALTFYNALNATSSQEDIDVALRESLEAADSILLFLTQIGIELESLPYDRQDLDDLISDVSNQSASLSNITLALKDTQNKIISIKTGSLEDIETLILSYQLQIDAAESKYNSAVNALTEAAYNLDQAKLNAEIADNNVSAFATLKKAALDSANAALALKKSPARSVDLAPLSAKINQAQIALQIAEKELRESQLFAPIDGLVTFIYGKIGENISLTEASLTPFLSIQADNLIVEANVPETDIVKIKDGDPVEMTIDAFDFTEKFNGEVIYIDHAETVIQGVIYYEIKTTFDLEDERLKSGMTTNLEIITDKKSDVLIIPIRAIKFEDSIRYVEVLKNGASKKVIITTGLESDQFAEVTSGLKEGDKIITFVK